MKSLKIVTNLIFKEKFTLILTGLFCLFLFSLWAKFGDPVIDCGREAYIPYSMAFLEKVLYKDIISIYGPIPYYLNALIMRVFGPSLNVLYSTGAILSCAFILTFFNILKRFLGALCAFFVSALILVLCVFSPLIHNFIFPYSYATIYALVFAVFYLYFLLKFIDEKSPKTLYFAAFFASLCVLSKFDFMFLPLVMAVLMILYRKNLDLRRFLNVLLCFFTPFALVLAIFLIQKVTLNDVFLNFKYMLNMAKAPSLLYFYENFTGYFFNFNKTFSYLPSFLSSFSVMALLFALSGLVKKCTNKFLKSLLWLSLIGFSAFLFIEFSPEYTFYYFPLIILLYLVFYGIYILYKAINKGFKPVSDDDIKFFTVIIFSLLISLKALFGLSLSFYGIYYLPFILLSASLIFFRSFKTLSKLGIITILASLFVVFFFFNFLAFFGLKTFKINTPAGYIYASPHIARPLNQAIYYLDKNLTPEDSLLVLPEGLFVNFVLKKDYPLFNTSFTPLDFDAYGEKYLTESVSAHSPKYILILPRKFDDYGKGPFCKGFGLEFCSKINKNYVFKRSFPENPQGTEDTLILLERKRR